MTFLGPIERLHFWRTFLKGNRGRTLGNAERRETEDLDDRDSSDTRYTMHSWRGTHDGD
jgi:hypothetical protein